MHNATQAIKRLGLLLAVLMLLCLAPGSARANAPAPDPYWKTIILSDTSEVASIAVYVDGPEGIFRLLETFESEHTKDQTIHFERPRDAARFYIEVTLADGTIQSSQPVDGSEKRQTLRYDVQANTLKKVITNQLGWLFFPLIMFILFLPLAFTIAVEVIVAVCYQFNRLGNVLLINLVTNLLMNCLLFYLRSMMKGQSTLWVTVLLEIVVVVVEYLFYTKKYPDYTKGKRLSYTLVANAISWGLFELVMKFFGI